MTWTLVAAAWVCLGALLTLFFARRWLASLFAWRRVAVIEGVEYWRNRVTGERVAVARGTAGTRVNQDWVHKRVANPTDRRWEPDRRSNGSHDHRTPC